MIFEESAKATMGKKKISSTNNAGKTEYPHAKKKLEFFLIPNIKVKSK